jgi:uracil-DNA glycosylase
MFPFHPHKNGNTRSNRTPEEEELKQGLKILDELLKLFDIKTIVAVGKKAESQIKGCTDIRHPANGGKNEFVEGLASVLNLK